MPLGEFGLHDFGIDLARSSKVEDLARPVIEHGFDVGELLGRDGAQIAAGGPSPTPSRRERFAVRKEWAAVQPRSQDAIE